MKRTARRTQKATVPAADPWNASPLDDFAEPFNDPLGEDLAEYEDRRDAMEVLAQRIIRFGN